MNSFTFAGHNCKNYGFLCNGGGTYNAPQADIEVIEIPGRNGTLTIDRKRYKNIAVIYHVGCSKDFPANAASVRNWLMPHRGYERLTDDYDTTHFRLARFSGAINFETGFLNRNGHADITFDCRPERFLLSGETVSTVTESGLTINNPTAYTAKPLLTVYGSGEAEFAIGSTEVQISNIDGFVTIDCEAMQAYKGSVNKNATITAEEFPVLEPGENSVNWTGGITKIEITPRWWEL